VDNGAASSILQAGESSDTRHSVSLNDNICAAVGAGNDTHGEAEGIASCGADGTSDASVGTRGDSDGANDCGIPTTSSSQISETKRNVIGDDVGTHSNISGVSDGVRVSNNINNTTSDDADTACSVVKSGIDNNLLGSNKADSGNQDEQQITRLSTVIGCNTHGHVESSSRVRGDRSPNSSFRSPNTHSVGVVCTSSNEKRIEATSGGASTEETTRNKVVITTETSSVSRDERSWNDDDTRTRPSGQVRRNSDVAWAGASHASDGAEANRADLIIELREKTTSDTVDIGIDSRAAKCRVSGSGARESSNINDGGGELEMKSATVRKPFSGDRTVGGVNDDKGGASVTLPGTDGGPLLVVSGDRSLVGHGDSHYHTRIPSNIYEAEQALREFDCSSKWGPSSSITRFDRLTRHRKLTTTQPAGWGWVEIILRRFPALGNLKAREQYHGKEHDGTAVATGPRSEIHPSPTHPRCEIQLPVPTREPVRILPAAVQADQHSLSTNSKPAADERPGGNLFSHTLPNVGNTCFFNSALQTVASIPSLVAAIEAAPLPSDNDDASYCLAILKRLIPAIAAPSSTPSNVLDLSSVAGHKQRMKRQHWLDLIVRITVKNDTRYVFGALADPGDLLDYFLSIVPEAAQMHAIDFNWTTTFPCECRARQQRESKGSERGIQISVDSIAPLAQHILKILSPERVSGYRCEHCQVQSSMTCPAIRQLSLLSIPHFLRVNIVAPLNSAGLPVDYHWPDSRVRNTRPVSAYPTISAHTRSLHTTSSNHV
jgi:hypothetical protein